MTNKATQFSDDSPEHWKKWWPSYVSPFSDQNVPIFQLAGGIFHA